MPRGWCWTDGGCLLAQMTDQIILNQYLCSKWNQLLFYNEGSLRARHSLKILFSTTRKNFEQATPDGSYHRESG